MSFCLSSVGCSIGIKEKHTIIYSGFAKEPEEAKGAIKIATNNKIKVTIGSHASEMDLGGMYVIRGSDLKAFVKALKAVGNIDGN